MRGGLTHLIDCLPYSKITDPEEAKKGKSAGCPNHDVKIGVRLPRYQILDVLHDVKGNW